MSTVMPSTRRPARTAALVAAPLAALALVAACGSTPPKTATPTPTTSLPTQDVTLPAGVVVTKPGAELALGQPATIGFAPTTDKSTGLELTVQKVQQGRIADLAAYQLDAQAKASRPYYVTVRVRNVGTGDVGRSAIPLFGLSSANTLIGASGFTNSFATCASGPLPDSFPAAADTSTCLMYLVPRGASLVGVSYRPVTSDKAIVWKGAVTPPPPKPVKKKKNKQ
jgi:hypothetical protein